LPHSRGFIRGRTSGRRRAMEWDEGPLSTAVQSATVAGLFLIGVGQAVLETLTIVRIRGELAVWLPLSTSVGDGWTTFSAGIGIVTADAFAVGATAMPGPATDADWKGWLWHHSGASLIGLETTEVGRGPLSAVRIPIDTKAMRKVSLNEVVFGAVEFVTEVGTAQADFTMNSRLLAKLA